MSITPKDPHQEFIEIKEKLMNLKVNNRDLFDKIVNEVICKTVNQLSEE